MVLAEKKDRRTNGTELGAQKYGQLIYNEVAKNIK